MTPSILYSSVTLVEEKVWYIDEKGTGLYLCLNGERTSDGSENDK